RGRELHFTSSVERDAGRSEPGPLTVRLSCPGWLAGGEWSLVEEGGRSRPPTTLSAPPATPGKDRTWVVASTSARQRLTLTGRLPLEEVPERLSMPDVTVPGATTAVTLEVGAGLGASAEGPLRPRAEPGTWRVAGPGWRLVLTPLDRGAR